MDETFDYAENFDQDNARWYNFEKQLTYSNDFIYQ